MRLADAYPALERALRAVKRKEAEKELQDTLVEELDAAFYRAFGFDRSGRDPHRTSPWWRPQ
jgi:hypothetical protein